MVRTIREQTGFRRMQKETICQNHYLLMRVTEYDFDLSNKEFVEYCKNRGRLHLARRDAWWDFVADHTLAVYEIGYPIFVVMFAYAQKQADGTQYKYTKKQMDVHWELMLAAKGGMQDCWELFSNNN